MGKIKHNREEGDDLEAATMFHALGDTTRLRIFNLLRVHANEASSSTPTVTACTCDDEDCDGCVSEASNTDEVFTNTVNLDSELPLPIKKAKAKTDKSAKGAKKVEEIAPGAVTVGDICLFITGEKKFTSVISHHLKELRHAGLITVERSGKMKLCRVNQEAADALCAYLCAPTLSETSP